LPKNTRRVYWLNRSTPRNGLFSLSEPCGKIHGPSRGLSFFETLPAPVIVARAGAANGKFAERLAAFEAAKQTRTSA